MPGIIGFIGKSYPEGAENLLRDMAQALDPSKLSIVDLYHEHEMGLGRVSLGIVNLGPQPVCNAEKTLCLVMEGELYDTVAIKKDLIQRGYHFQLNNDPELILNLYQEYGNDFALKLNGAFVLAIWDRLAQKLILANDRLGLYPLYYAETNGGLVFASGIRALLVDTSICRRVDKTAIAEFLTYDHVLQQRTLLEDVRLFPQGSILTFQDHRLNIHRYHELRYTDVYPLRSEDEYIEEYLHLLKQAVSRQMDDLPSGLLLSGGLDSRVLLALLSEIRQKDDFFAFTWGIPGCDDARYAIELAAKVGVRHQFFELKADWLLTKAQEAVSLTDGMGNIVNLHALATLDQEVEYAKVLYKGFLGDAMMGFAVAYQFWANYDDLTRIKVHQQVHSDQGLITFSSKEYSSLFSNTFLEALGTSIQDDYVAGIDDTGSFSLADQRVYFDYRQRVPRMTINGVEVARSRAIVRLPYADNDLVEFSLRLPPGLRYERRLPKNALIHAYPSLAQVPLTGTGLPMMMCARDVFLRGKEVVRWHLDSRGLGRLLSPARKAYKDYNRWFRTVLREWVEKTLLDPQTLERGYFKPDYIRQTIQDHMAGANYASRIGALMSLELWHRMYID